jgi:hypothetical protein
LAGTLQLQKEVVMQKYLIILILTAMVFLFIACKDESTSSSPAPVDYKTSGCISPGLGKRIAGVSADSIFSYHFTGGGLDLNFTVGATCGRKENAFLVNCTVRDDTIDVHVIDTCMDHARCFCIYMATVSTIPVVQDRYIVRCTFIDSIYSQSYVAHVVEVHR